MMKFDSDKYREVLLNHISSAKPASGGKEILCRCFYCPDSSNINHKHFYISIPMDDSPSVFYCQKCHTSGIVTHNTLMEWGIYDLSVSVDLTKYNNRVMKLSKNQKYVSSEKVFTLSNPVYRRNDMSEKKLVYINNRLGTNLSYSDLSKEKIVLDLKSVLEANNIQNITRHPNVIDQLSSFFIGFISYDNGFINMRNLVKDRSKLIPTIQKRYVNYNIFDKYDNTKRFYISPTDVQLITSEPIQLHLTEGPFDILSIKYNLRGSNGNNIFASVNGSGYMGLLKFSIVSLKLMNLVIHLYPDNDMNDDYIIHNIVNPIRVFRNRIFIHRNTMDGEKDFGVKKEKIREYIREV